MQISLKLLLYKQKTYSDGSHPVVLQYIYNRKAKKKVLTRCKPEDWDAAKGRLKKSAPGANTKNEFIASEYAKAEVLLYDIKSGERKVGDIFEETETYTLRAVFDLELTRLEREKKAGAYDKILVFQKQIKDLDVRIADMNRKWFERFIHDLATAGNNPNTIKKKLNTIKQIIKRYDRVSVPEDVNKVNVQAAKTLKQKLTAEELARLEKLDLPEDDLMTAARDFFLMQIYLRGIRIGDLLQARSEDFKNGTFTYRSDKTDTPLAIKLIPQAIAIVEKYQGKSDRLFPFFTWKYDKKLNEFTNDRRRLKHKELCTSVINRFLKSLAIMAGINKPLSSHIARHTFARMAIDKINNPMVTMELLGHSSLAVHQAYLNDIRKEDALNQAADDIFKIE